MNTRSTFRSVLIKLIIFAAVSVLITTVVAETLLDLHVRSTTSFGAEFSNVAGLQSGDTVRVAGVEVGKIGGVHLTGDHAVVSFDVDSSQHLTDTTRAEIHYENVIGQRFLALIAGPPGGQPLPGGAMIPMSRTAPALDLTSVFNGFQPLFAALTPDQVNQLTASIIQVFQGEAGTVSTLTSQTASLTANLADRQQVIDEVLTNLSGLVSTVADHDQQLGQLIDQFSSMVNALASDRPQLAGTIDGVQGLTSSLSSIINQEQPALDQDIGGLASFTGSLAANQQAVDAAIQDFPGFITAINKTISSGSYLSVYVCNLSLQAQGQLNISLIPGVPAPQFPDPLILPSGSVGDQSQHTANCR